MENIIEKCVIKPKEKLDKYIIAITVFISFIICLIPILFFHIIAYSPVIILVTVFIAYNIVVSRNIEYEYEFVENLLTVSKIINKSRRRLLFKGILNDFDIIAQRKSKYFEEYGRNVQVNIKSISAIENENVYFGIIQYKNKRTCLFFEADDRILKHIKKQVDFKLKNSWR